MRIAKLPLVFLAVSIVLVAAFLYRTPLKASASDPIQVRWLLSHQPTDVFDAAIEVFADELSKNTNGRMVLTVVTPEDIGVSAGDVPNTKVFDLLDSGQVELATTYTVALGKEDPTLWKLNLPFYFDGYGEIDEVLDGPIGAQLLQGISDSTSARGLAFTMSGGLRIIASKNSQIDEAQDLKGLRIGTSGGPVAEATLRALGAVPVPLDLESGNVDIDANTVDAVETTYSRLSQVLGDGSAYVRYINETNHSLFLTTILASGSFYDGLSLEDRDALVSAARAAASVERRDSVELADETRTQLAREGSTIVALPPVARDAFIEATKVVYKEFGTLAP